MRKTTDVSKYVQKRGDVYQFSRRIPKETLAVYQQVRKTNLNSIPEKIKKYFSGTTFVRFSLKTKNMAAAKRLGVKEAAHFELMLRRLNEWLKMKKSPEPSIGFSEIEHLSWKWFDREFKMLEMERYDPSQVDRIRDETTAYGCLFDVYKGYLTLQGRGRRELSICTICDAILREEGYIIKNDSPLYQKLHDDLILRHRDIHLALKARNNGESIEFPRPQTLPCTLLVGRKKNEKFGGGLCKESLLAIGDVIEHYLEGLPPNKFKRKPRRVLGLFAEFIGKDTAVKDVRQIDVTNFLRVISYIPVKCQGKIELNEVLARALSNYRNPMEATECISYLTWKDNCRAPLGTFFKKAYKNQGISDFAMISTDHVNYPREKGCKSGKRQRALSDQELKILYEGDRFREMSSRAEDASLYWLAVIALFTGARPREICQLNPQVDFGRLDGMGYIDIDATSPAGRGVKKTVKTGESRRIPIHPELNRLGFVDYLQRMKSVGADRLFPEVGVKGGNPFSTLGEAFTKLLKDVGLYKSHVSSGNNVLGIYSLRKTFITLARNQRVLSMGITGHAHDAWVTEIQARHYISGAEPFSLLVEEISRLKIPVQIPMRDDVWLGAEKEGGS